MSIVKMVTLADGFFWGAVAALVTTPFAMAHTDDAPAPTALLCAKLAGGPPEEYLDEGTAVYLCLGTAAGVALAGLEPRYFVEWVEFGTLTESLVSGLNNGLVYGLLLFVVAVVGVGVGQGRAVARERGKTLLVATVLYGAVLGLGFGYQLH